MSTQRKKKSGRALYDTLTKLWQADETEIKELMHSFRVVHEAVMRPVLAVACTLFVLLYLYRWWRRQRGSARDWRQVALGQRQSRDMRRSLERAIKKDPSYQPAYMTLAALELYSEECPTQALRVLERWKAQQERDWEKSGRKTREDEDVRILRLDAEAMASGNDRMIPFDLRKEQYFCPDRGGANRAKKSRLVVANTQKKNL